MYEIKPVPPWGHSCPWCNAMLSVCYGDYPNEPHREGCPMILFESGEIDKSQVPAPAGYPFPNEFTMAASELEYQKVLDCVREQWLGLWGEGI